MKKEVLSSAIEELGIREGDLVKINLEGYKDYFIYEDGVFKNLKDDFALGDDFVFELIAGSLDYECVGNSQRKRIEGLQEKLSVVQGDIDDIKCNYLKDCMEHESIKQTVDMLEKESENNKILKKQDFYICLISNIVMVIMIVLLLLF